MNLKIGQKFVNANGVECEVISFGEGRVLYKIMGSYYDTLISSFENVITFNGYIAK